MAAGGVAGGGEDESPSAMAPHAAVRAAKAAPDRVINRFALRFDMPPSQQLIHSSSARSRSEELYLRSRRRVAAQDSYGGKALSFEEFPTKAGSKPGYRGDRFRKRLEGDGGLAWLPSQ